MLCCWPDIGRDVILLFYSAGTDQANFCSVKRIFTGALPALSALAECDQWAICAADLKKRSTSDHKIASEARATSAAFEPPVTKISSEAVERAPCLLALRGCEKTSTEQVRIRARVQPCRKCFKMSRASAPEVFLEHLTEIQKLMPSKVTS
jgi:hypothetical protein